MVQWIFFNLYTRSGCHISSDAWATSRGMAQQYFFYSRELVIESVNRRIWWKVVWSLRKPNWVCGIIYTSFMKKRYVLGLIFHIRSQKEQKTYWRYGEGMSGGFPGFKIKTITELFHFRGKWENLKIKLNI